MQNNATNPDSIRQINNLVARIKSRYPHLYEETGGKYIRKILKTTLAANGAEEAKNEPELRARILKHKHQNKAA